MTRKILLDILKFLLVTFSAFLLTDCTTKSKKSPTNKEILLALIVYNYQQTKDPNDCRTYYGRLNSLYSNYYNSEFVNYSNSCETVIIGDSTMDLARTTSFYDKTKTHNYSVSGNNACDYFYQIEAIKCNPKNVLLATSDGNGVLKKVSSQISINTINKVIVRVKEKWNPKIVIVGIHPVLLTSENIAKNSVNQGVKQFGYCYIDPLPIFGVGENDPPSESVMLDSIHYNSTIYPLYKTQIESQCGLFF